jgi:hypothetical protein
MVNSLPAHYSNETQLTETRWHRPHSAPLITQIFAVIGPLMDPKDNPQNQARRGGWRKTRGGYRQVRSRAPLYKEDFENPRTNHIWYSHGRRNQHINQYETCKADGRKH